jgi:hypothetical protein
VEHCFANKEQGAHVRAKGVVPLEGVSDVMSATGGLIGDVGDEISDVAEGAEDVVDVVDDGIEDLGDDLGSPLPQLARRRQYVTAGGTATRVPHRRYPRAKRRVLPVSIPRQRTVQSLGSPV